MSASRFLHANGQRLLGVLLLTTALSIPSFADTKLKIASVPPEMLPLGGPHTAESIVRHNLEFEIDKETGRARLVVDYIYRGASAFASDPGPWPAPVTAQVPGLRYDAASNAVVYEHAGQRIVCAHVRDHKMLFWKTEAIVPTGACTVRVELVSRKEDTGWKLRSVSTLETYFEVD